MSNKTQGKIAKRKQAEEEQRKSYQELQVFFSQTIDGCFFMMLDEPVRWDETTDKEQVLDYAFAHQRLTRINDALLAQYGATREQMLNLAPNDLLQHNLAYGRELWRKLFDAGKIHLENEEHKLDGTPMWIKGEYIALYDSEGRISGYFGIQRDITERKRTEMEFARVNRALRMLSDVNQTVIYAVDETALLYEVCRIAVEGGGYLMAWVGFAEQDEAKTVRPVTHAGFEEGYLESLDLTWAESGRGDGPVGTAIRTGQWSIVRNLSSQQWDDDWLETAVQRGYNSIIALPLNSEGQVLGTLNIYASEADAFDDKEVEILEELAADLAFGLTALRNQAKRNQAEEALRQSEERYRLIAENTADTIAVFDLNLNPTYISPAVLKLRGYTAQEALTQSLAQMLTPESFQKAQSALIEQMLLEAEGTADLSRTVMLELEEYCKDGSTIWVEISASFLRDTNLTPTGILTVTRNITGRKRAKDALRERELHAQSLVRLSRRLEQAQTYGEILDAGATEVRNTIGYQNLWIYLLSEDKTTCQALMAGGPMGEEILSEQGAATLTITGDLMLEEIANTREIVLVEDARTDKRTNKEIVAQLGNRTIINVPIVLFDRHLGSVGTGTFGDEGIRIPTQTEQEYLVAVASHFAVSLDRIHSLIEREQASAALRESEERFSKAFHLSPVGIAIFRAADGRFVDVNDDFVRTSGYSREEIIGHTALELQLYANPEERDSILQTLYEKGTLEVFEFQTRNKSGEIGAGLSATTEITLGGEKHYLSLILDITERKRAEEERQAYLWFLESMDRVNRAMQGINDIEQMTRDVLDVVLSIFDCDRAYLLYPCDPEAPSWSSPMERTRPEYPGVFDLEMEVAMDAEVAKTLHILLDADAPVKFGPGMQYPLPANLSDQFSIQSFMAMALYPKINKPWQFGIHQCSYPRVWTPEEERLLQVIGRRLADALTSLLAHRALRESEERYRTIFQNAPLGIFRSTFDGRFLEVNPALARILGYDSPESAIYETHDIARYTRPGKHQRMISKQLRSPGVVQYLDHYRRKDGSEFISNLYLKTIRDAANRPVFLEGIVEDITEREQAEGDLRKLSHAIEQSPVVIIITDTDGDIEYVNPRFTQLSGYTRDEVLGKNPRFLKSGETNQSEYRQLWDTITRGGEWQGEFHNKKKTGEFYWVSASISPVLDSEGNIKNFVGVQEDITVRKQREGALEALVTVAMALRAAPGRDEVAYIVVNQVFELLRNGSVALLLRYPQDDELQVTAVRGTWEQWHSIRFPLGDEVSSRVIGTGRPYINNDVEAYMQVYQPDLIDSLSAVACVPLIAENEVIGVLWVGQQSAIESHDVQLLKAVADMAATAIRRAVLYEQTQRYAAELETRVTERTQELAKANEQLLELDQLKTKFVSDVSHELRTPITNLQLYLDLLKQGKPEKREHYIAVLVQQANRLTRLVEDILDLSRLELGGNRAVFAPVNLNQLVEQIVTTYQPSAENANLRLTFEPGPDLPPVIGEINQLAQVVTNLVGNALNYTLRGSIRVWTHLEDDWVCLDVADTGIGIAPEDIAHLFERFYRGKFVSQRNIPGTGLGLAIIKEIVDLHNGRIKVNSQPGKGATFSVHLPIVG